MESDPSAAFESYSYWILAAYFLPTLIAVLRQHHNAVAIVAVNVLLGWTFVGWFWAFIWSLTRAPKLRIASDKN